MKKLRSGGTSGNILSASMLGFKIPALWFELPSIVELLTTKLSLWEREVWNLSRVHHKHMSSWAVPFLLVLLLLCSVKLLAGNNCSYLRLK